MPEAPKKEGEKQSFADFLRELPAESDTVRLTGFVARSAKEGVFLFTPVGGGQPVELPVEAVRSHEVVREAKDGPFPMHLEVDRTKAGAALGQILKVGVFDKVHKDPIADKVPVWDKVHKDPPYDKHPWTEKIHKDPIFDQVAGPGVVHPGDPVQLAGLAPFVLATPHHAPQAPLAMQAAGLAGQLGGLRTIKEVPKDPLETLKEATKDPLYDPTLKEVVKDPITDPTLKEVPKDPLYDPTLKELPKDPIYEQTLVEPGGGGTLAEGGGGGTLAEGGGFGGGPINQF